MNIRNQDPSIFKNKESVHEKLEEVEKLKEEYRATINPINKIILSNKINKINRDIVKNSIKKY